MAISPSLPMRMNKFPGIKHWTGSEFYIGESCTQAAEGFV